MTSCHPQSLIALDAVDLDADGMRGLEAPLDSPTQNAPSPWDALPVLGMLPSPNDTCDAAANLDAVRTCGLESLDVGVGPTPLFWATPPFFG